MLLPIRAAGAHLAQNVQDGATLDAALGWFVGARRTGAHHEDRETIELWGRVTGMEVFIPCKGHVYR